MLHLFLQPYNDVQWGCLIWIGDGITTSFIGMMIAHKQDTCEATRCGNDRRRTRWAVNDWWRCLDVLDEEMPNDWSVFFGAPSWESPVHWWSCDLCFNRLHHHIPFITYTCKKILVTFSASAAKTSGLASDEEHAGLGIRDAKLGICEEQMRRLGLHVESSAAGMDVWWCLDVWTCFLWPDLARLPFIPGTVCSCFGWKTMAPFKLRCFGRDWMKVTASAWKGFQLCDQSDFVHLFLSLYSQFGLHGTLKCPPLRLPRDLCVSTMYQRDCRAWSNWDENFLECFCAPSLHCGWVRMKILHFLCSECFERALASQCQRLVTCLIQQLLSTEYCYPWIPSDPRYFHEANRDAGEATEIRW